MRYLLEIDTPFTADVYLWRMSGIIEIKLAGLVDKAYREIIAHYDGVPQVYADDITTVRIGLDLLNPVDSADQCFVNPGSIYFEKSRNALLVNIARYEGRRPVEGWQTPTGKRIIIGIIVGFCDQVDYTRPDKSFYGNSYYPPRLKTLPTINAKRDSLFYGRQVFNPWQATLVNTDGHFDSLNYTGCFTRVLAVPDGANRSDGVRISFGKIDKATKGDDYTISAEDVRWRLEKDATIGKFETTVFPYLAKDDIGKKIPIYINKHVGIEPVCVNRSQDLSESMSSTFDYCIGASPDPQHTVYGVDRVYTRGSSGSVVIGSGFAFGTNYRIGINRRDLGNLKIDVQYGDTWLDLRSGRDYFLTPIGDGFYWIRFAQYSGRISGNTSAITISAESTDNDDQDIEADVTGWTCKLYDKDTGIATVSIPASTESDGGTSPMSIYVDLFGWYNKTAGETKWLNAADIISTSLYMLAGYAYDANNFDLKNWEIEREKIKDDAIHLSPKIEDDVTINDFLNTIAQSALVILTNRSDSLFDIRLDSSDNLPSFTLDKNARMELQDVSEDNAELVSKLTITYGADTSRKQTYETSQDSVAEIEALNIINEKQFDMIISDTESVKRVASYIENRTKEKHPIVTFKLALTDELRSAWFTQSMYAPSSRDGSTMAAYDILGVSILLGDNQITITARHRWDVDFEEGYIQGVMVDDFICGEEIPAATENVA